MDIEEENVKVVVRIRPMQTEEKKSGDVPCVKGVNDGREVQVKVGPLDAQVYRCNHCFNPETNQVDFFHESGITDLLDSAIQGYRACAFAFGQTGAGKTHTMIGSAKGISSRDKNVGLVPRSLDYLYEKLNQMNLKYKIKLSCLEIYHEHVYDLFAEDKERTPMAVREHNVEGFFLEGARLVDCSNYNIACNVLDVAFKNRQVGFHDLNSRSSRSHCMTEIYIETFPDPEGNPEQVVRGKMSLVDLAGSERLKSTNSTGKVLQEAGFINRSLYVLGKVIAGLVRTNGDLNHKDVPYRDSKLTKLLISSLGGSSRTLMISCVSEAKGSQAETLRTLKFSMSCARIRNKPIKFLDPQEKLIVDLKDEIKRLRQENQRLRSTLVTAPTSTDSMHSLIGGEDMSPSRMRASSANSSVSPTRRRISPEKMRKAGGGPGMSKKRTNAIAGVGGQGGGKKMKNTKKKKPDIFYKYPQLERILGDDDSIESFTGSPKRGRLRPSKGTRVSDGSGGGDGGGGGSHMSASEAIMMGGDGYDEQQHSRHDDGNHSVHSMNSHGGPRRMRPEVLDEMVHRRAPGPMIFKDVQHAPYEPLRDSRLNKYYPAENHIKSMDQMKIDVLEQRIAKMEAQQQRLERLQAAGKGGATAAAGAGDDVAADDNDAASYQDDFHDGEAPHGHHPSVQGIPPSNAYDDDATIQNSIAIDGSELVKAGKKGVAGAAGAGGGSKKTQKKKKDKGVSPYIAHLGANKIQKFQQALDEKPRKAVESIPPAGKMAAAAAPAAGKPKLAAPAAAPPKPKAAQERKDNHESNSVAMVRQSIDQELEELGLSEILGKPSSHMPNQADFANVISAATKKPTGTVTQSKSTPQIDHAAKKNPPTNSNGNGSGSSSGNNNNKQTTGGPNKSQSLPQIQSKQQQVDGGALVHAANTRKRGSRDAGDTTTEKLPPIKAAAAATTTTSTATNVPAATKKTAATDDSVQQKQSAPVAARASSASSPAGKKPPVAQKSPATAAKAGPTVGSAAKKASSSSSSPTKKSIDTSHGDAFNYKEDDDDDDFMPPTPDRLKEKLHALEASLMSKRIEMEDNPGDVTNEIEEKFKNLQLETLVIKQQLSELAGDAFPVGDSEKQAMGPGKSPVRPPPGQSASADAAEEEDEENYEDDYYGEDDFENDDAGAGGSPKRPRTRGSPAKHVEEANDAEKTGDDAEVTAQKEPAVAVAVVATAPAAAVSSSTTVSPIAVKSPSTTTVTAEKTSSFSSPSSKISSKTEDDAPSKVVASPVVAAVPVVVESTKSPSPSAAQPAAVAKPAPDNTDADGNEEDNYEDDYDVDFEADDDKAPSRAASPSKSKKSSPTRTSSSSVPSGTTEDQQQSTPTSVVQTDKATFSSPSSKAANDSIAAAPAEAEPMAPVAPPSSSPPPRRAKTPAKTPADDDYDAYAEDGFDDFDVSFNEDN